MTLPTYYLYLDETGSFEPNARSAIGGLCSPTPISRADAEAWWEEVLGHPRGEVFHANEYPGDLSKLLSRAIEAWQTRGWNPLILEHVTRGQIVDNATTYVHVFADGIVKVARSLARKAGKDFNLQVLAANRSLPVSPGSDTKERMHRDLYESRLKERIAVEMLRGAVRPKDPTWTYSLAFASATQDPCLMMADLACYAWHGGKRLSSEVQDRWQVFLGPHYYQSLRSADDERIQHLREQGAHGAALMEALALLAHSKQHPLWLLDLRNAIIDDLAEFDAATRDTAIEAVMARLRYEIDVRRDFQAGELLLAAWKKHFVGPLRNALPGASHPEIAWVEAQTLCFELAAANHRGAVGQAENIMRVASPLGVTLAGRFERLPLALHIRILEAVHLTNVYAFKEALASMRDLAHTLDNLLSLMGELTPGANLSTLRSDVLGRALGTGLQAATMAARREPALYDVARDLSERALQEFESVSDRQRQWGYRAQLETDAGQWASARQYLALSLGVSLDAPMEDLVKTAKANPFGVMHLARYWAAITPYVSVEAESLRQAFLQDGIDQLSVWQAGVHPAHVVFWKSGVALAALGERARARVSLDRAIQLAEAAPEALTVRTIGLGAQADRLALLLELGEKNALRAASEKLQSTLQAVAGPTAPMALQAYFSGWPQRLGAALADGSSELLRALAAEVPH